MKETIIIAICTIIAAIAGTILANYLNIKREDRNENKFEKSIIQSIESELKTLWNLFGEDLIKNLESMKETEIYTYIYTARYDYFNIYNANSLFIGRIKISKLRNTIIETYIQAKSFLEELVNYGDEYKKFKFEKEQFLKLLNANLTYAISSENMEYLLQNPTITALSDLNIVNYTKEQLLDIDKFKNQTLNNVPDLIRRTQELKKTFITLKEQFKICLNFFEDELKPKIPRICKICFISKYFCHTK